MDSTTLTIEDFQPHELEKKADAFDILLTVAERASEKLASSSSAPSKKRKIHSRTPSPAEELAKIVAHVSLRHSTTPPKMVIEKKLFATDLSNHHNRLSIPIAQIEDDFLTETEKQLLRGRAEDTSMNNYLQVRLMAAAPAPEEETVKLTRWDTRKKSSSYVIIGKWSDFVEKIKLRVGMTVQLWSFRLDGELCFALVRSRAAA